MLMDPMLLFFLDFSGFHMLFSDFLFYLGIMIFQSYQGQFQSYLKTCKPDKTYQTYKPSYYFHTQMSDITFLFQMNIQNDQASGAGIADILSSV